MTELAQRWAPKPLSPDLLRRDLLNIAAVSVAGVGGAALLYPPVDQMNPSADVLAVASIDVDISAIRPGRRSRRFAQAAALRPHLTLHEIQASEAVDPDELRNRANISLRGTRRASSAYQQGARTAAADFPPPHPVDAFVKGF